jgi:hypothetical protein
MAKKNAPIEEPFEELTVEATEPTVEAVNPLANGYPSRDFFSPLPGVSEGKAPVEVPAQNGGQEEA